MNKLPLELLLCGAPDNWLLWLTQGGYTFHGSYYIIILTELLFLFPVIYRLADTIDGSVGIPLILLFHLLYEWLTFKTGLPGKLYRLLLFRYVIFLYCGCLLAKTRHLFAVSGGFCLLARSIFCLPAIWDITPLSCSGMIPGTSPRHLQRVGWLPLWPSPCGGRRDHGRHRRSYSRKYSRSYNPKRTWTG